MYDERLKYRSHRNDDDYHIDSNGNPPSRGLEKSRHYANEEYSSSNRIANDCLNYSSMRLDRQKTSRDIYTPPLTNLSGGLSPTDLYYSSLSTRGRNALSHYPNSERSRYPSPPHPHPSIYRRDASPRPSSSYREDYVPRSNHNESYVSDDYRSLTPVSLRSNTDTYNDTYQTNDYTSRPERYDITLLQNIFTKRNGSSRDYAIASIPSPIYRSDTYRTSSSIPLSSSSSSSSSLPLTSSSSSLYTTREQYSQAFPSGQEIDYRSRTYGMETPTDSRHINSNKTSSRYYAENEDDQYRSSSYSNRSNFKRSRTSYIENEYKRSLRRWE
ncbi:unnamed protein product [Adineta ricciae]|uniref:Uncharacterized protein n=1 Tax=Adineta ricciae TaxID=249248 RepID=A0A814P307_ADIRI|nr:unnamed protein product [Adineta ricciae]